MWIILPRGPKENLRAFVTTRQTINRSRGLKRSVNNICLERNVHRSFGVRHTSSFVGGANWACSFNRGEALGKMFYVSESPS
jgi:hypothetical protein